MTQTAEYDVAYVDANQTGKTVTINEALLGLTNGFGKTLTVPCGGGGTITPAYSSSEGGDKTGLQFAILKLTGSPAGAFNISLPNKGHVFVCKNTTGQTANIGAAAVAAGTNKLVFYDGSGWATLT